MLIKMYPLHHHHTITITARVIFLPIGVDETVTIILQYSGKRQAILTCTIMVAMPNQAAICGSTGMIQVFTFSKKKKSKTVSRDSTLWT